MARFAFIQRTHVRPIRVPTRILERRERAKALKGTNPDPMFTGIVQEATRALEFTQTPTAWRLMVRSAALAEVAKVGDSIAVSGICLTVTAVTGKSLRFDVLEETRQVTTLAGLAPGALVNLEPALALGGRVGGHFVTGHVDCTGIAEVFEVRGADRYLKVVPPPEYLRYVIHKGSVAVDGISLTVAEVDERSFAVWIIPHTFEVTALREVKPGQPVNLEFDLLAKHVEKLLASQGNTRTPFPLPAGASPAPAEG